MIGPKAIPAISRRHFLFAAGASGAVAATALVATGKDGTVQPTKLKAPASNGYHVTEHIRNYYRTTKV